MESGNDGTIMEEETTEPTKRTLKQNFIVGILAVLGACSALIEMFTPLLLVFFWVKFFGFTGLGSYLLYVIAFLATAFRGIKIGWLKG